MTSDYSQLEQDLIALLDHLPADALEANWSDAELTRQLAARLGAAGQAAGFWVGTPHWAKADDPHWPWDLAWLERQGGQLKDVKVALAVEWDLDQGRIAERFQRLLACRAQARVMVAQQKTKEDAAACLEALAVQVKGFGQSAPGDRYLLACSDFKSAGFSYRLYVC